MTEIDYWIPGDHDHIDRSEYGKVPLPVKAPFSTEYGDYSFRFKHKRHRDIEGEYWLIHGHKHNENPNEYPFIDMEDRCINVSASMIGYQPISIDTITSLLETDQGYTVAPDSI